ncbi:MAG: NADH-quinone oxidoreductase subunit A [Acidobacteria bacterium]|nr:NADH-quinone oxidoreductase subunit A [Acidobacteriota bacterium]
MTTAYFPLLLALGVGAFVAFALWALGHFTGPKNWTREKMIPYESGSETTGAQGVRISAKFFITAILLVVFDVEVAFLYPWAVQFHELGTRGLVAMFAFLGVLGIALLYLVRKGALKWEE